MLEGNDFTNTELVNLQAEKVWKIGEDDITTIIRNASVTLKLQQKIDEGEWEDVELTGLTNQQTLSVGNTADANAWKAIWNGLPKYARVEENDVLIQYRVVETEAKLSAITLTTAEPVQIENGSAIVENTLPETGITVTKQWKDGTTATGGNDKVFDEVREISFTLYQKLDEGEPAVYTEYGENGVGTVAYTPQPGSWSTEEIAGLPCYVYNESTHTWSQATYSVVETAPEGVNVTYSQGGTPSSSAAYVGADSTEDERTITIINTDILLTRIDGNSTTISYIGSPVTPVTNGSNNLTGDDGSAVFSGLSVGYYEIWEKTLPTGFIRSADDGRFYIRVKDSVIPCWRSRTELRLRIGPNATVKRYSHLATILRTSRRLRPWATPRVQPFLTPAVRAQGSSRSLARS